MCSEVSNLGFQFFFCQLLEVRSLLVGRGCCHAFGGIPIHEARLFPLLFKAKGWGSRRNASLDKGRLKGGDPGYFILTLEACLGILLNCPLRYSDRKENWKAVGW